MNVGAPKTPRATDASACARVEHRHPNRTHIGFDRGCMRVNIVLETADVDAKLSASASRYLNDIERVFKDVLGDARATPAQSE